MKSDHHVEAFREDGTPDYGWQCFTCGEEKQGFQLVAQAEADAFGHGILPWSVPVSTSADGSVDQNSEDRAHELE